MLIKVANVFERKKLSIKTSTKVFFTFNSHDVRFEEDLSEKNLALHKHSKNTQAFKYLSIGS